MTATTDDAAFLAWMGKTGEALAALDDLDQVLRAGQALLAQRSDKLFAQIESDGYERAAAQEVLDAAASATAPAVEAPPGPHPVATRMQRAGRMV